ncbi:GntR family transcriptional regulator [Roseiconus nitratireducens]|uniref:GntR family transcriptional regulator n=1 Tax=Roseiconus nitratireducens TaxID=2605748 RepID=UPI001375DE64|nr:GntR family transcriptional regulator [Roseiconus nitratireducens]
MSESVYEQLIQMIVSGELESGQAVSESELSRRLDVSRTPIHEAVGQLVKDGLVIQERNRRPVVAAFSTDDIFDVYEMRRILESEAAAKAASRIDKLTLAQLDDAAKKFKSAKGKPAILRRWVEFDDQFHTAIAAACGSSRLESDIQRYRLLHRVFNRTHDDPSVLEQAYDEHALILKALKKRDELAARKAMNDHIAEWQRFFVKHLA